MLYYCFLAPTNISIIESVNAEHAYARYKYVINQPSTSMFLLQLKNIANTGLLVYAYGENSKQLWQEKFGSFELFVQPDMCGGSGQEVCMGRIKLKDEKEYARYLSVNHKRSVTVYYLNGDIYVQS